MSRIYVTQADIDSATPASASAAEKVKGCAIHCALQRHFPDAEIEVWRLHVLLNKQWVPLPESAAMFTSKADMGIPLQPFEFELFVK